MSTENTSSEASTSDQVQQAEVSAKQVNLGHIFALRPKVNTSFSQAVFLAARRELADERYGSLEEAARAVAAKALASANRKPSKHAIGRP